MAETFGTGSYAAISGVPAFAISGARAVAPVGASALYDATRGMPLAGHNAVLVVLLVFAAGRASRSWGSEDRMTREPPRTSVAGS